MEFDAFESSFDQVEGSGDVQDFLRREQDALGEFAPPAPTSSIVPAPAESDFFVDDAAVNGFGSVPQSATNPFGSNASDSFGNDDNSVPLADPTQPASDQETYYVSHQPEYVDPYAALSQVNETPQIIQEWRRKRDDLLDQKDKQSREKALQMERDAKAALEKFTKENDLKREATHKKNRDAQAATIAARDAPVKGNPWERVYNLVDLTPKGQKSTKDVSRIRSVLTQLKTDAHAPGIIA